MAQCVENSTNRVLLVGDSWAQFMLTDGTIDDGLKIIGHSDKKFVSNYFIAENGSQTDDFLAQDKQDEIQNLINDNPNIDIVHLSIGGNDVMGDWKVSMTPSETDAIEQAVADRLAQIVDFLKTTRNGMNIFWAGYAYPNFEEVINDYFLPSQHPFYSTWEDMEEPTFIQINTILNEFSDSVAAYADTEPALSFVRAQGILQHVYGQNQDLGVAPGGSYPAFDAPLPLGYPEYPSPMTTMRPYGIFTDCFHLSTSAYLTMFKYQAEKYYHKKLMDEFYVLSNGGTEDGSVGADGTVSQEIKFGEDGGNEIAAVLTFDTQAMADTVLENANIFLRRESLTGTDPTDANLEVRIVSGNFGATVDVEAADFNDVGDASGGPCVFGSSEEDGHWIRIDLPMNIINQTSNNDQMQVIISAPGFTGGVMTFHDASDPEKAPVLNLKYYQCSVPGTDVQTACNSFEWINGNTYYSSNNTATYTFPNGAANGCDSVVTLDLTLTSVNTNVAVDANTLTAELSGADYQWLDCDDGNSEISGETGQSFTATVSGNYAVEITYDGCVVLSECKNVNLSGINGSAMPEFKVYPNPTNSVLRIEAVNKPATISNTLSLEIFNVVGELIQNQKLIDNTIDLSDLPSGTYLLRITTNDGAVVKRIIKR